ncbi:MAG: hypothetical protein QXD89_02395 [Candidatus Aenigmatarchaeota archaeon]
MQFSESSAKLKKVIKELEKIKGRHTELVSVYIPAGYNIYDVINQIVEERSTAENIKSKTTRKNVVAALEKILQHLRLFKQTPPNGLVIFAGNISPVEGKEDIKLWSIEPPERLETKIYWCDQVFVLDPLKEMIKEKDVYGLIVVDAKEATIGLLKGKKIIVKKRLESTVPSKTVKGGMCLHRSVEIILTQNKKLPINKIKRGEEVICFDFTTKTIRTGVVKETYKRHVNNAKKIFFENESIIASEDHLIFVKENGEIREKYVKELKKGDIVFVLERGELREKTIKNISESEIEASVFFYDLEVEPYGNFFANNLLVHNSQGRYDRLREDAINEFLTKVGEIASSLFLEEKIQGVLIGGPGPIKERLKNEDYLHYQIKNKIIGIKDVGYTDEYGLEELVKRSEDLIQQAEIYKERSTLNRFFLALKKGENCVIGLEKVMKALEYNALEELIIIEDFEYIKAGFSCSNGHKIEKIVKREEKVFCEICGQEMKKDYENEIAEEIIEKAEVAGAKVYVVSEDTEEGKQFKNMGGIGGLTRFKIE